MALDKEGWRTTLGGRRLEEDRNGEDDDAWEERFADNPSPDCKDIGLSRSTERGRSEKEEGYKGSALMPIANHEVLYQGRVANDWSDEQMRLG